MALQIENIEKDPLCCPQERPASLESLTFSSHGCQVYGTALIPGGARDQTYPVSLSAMAFPVLPQLLTLPRTCAVPAW